ncbi:MAG: hypothetical protein COA58_05800 [Bacteroidetes bacterium]|nr:MAG: hypothetical protein COA58_05800 [Bacteroidota bacterium]
MKKLPTVLKTAQRISIVFIILGALCMIQHWPYGRETVYYSKIAFLLFTLAIFSFKKEKTYGHWASLVGLLSYLIYLLDIEALHFADYYLLVITGGAFVIWYWDIGMDQDFFPMRLSTNPSEGRLLNLLKIISVGTVVIGALFKIQHYPRADLLLIIGMVSTAVLMLISTFATKKTK